MKAIDIRLIYSCPAVTTNSVPWKSGNVLGGPGVLLPSLVGTPPFGGADLKRGPLTVLSLGGAHTPGRLHSPHAGRLPATMADKDQGFSAWALLTSWPDGSLSWVCPAHCWESHSSPSTCPGEARSTPSPLMTTRTVSDAATSPCALKPPPIENH